MNLHHPLQVNKQKNQNQSATSFPVVPRAWSPACSTPHLAIHLNTVPVRSTQPACTWFLSSPIFRWSMSLVVVDWVSCLGPLLWSREDYQRGSWISPRKEYCLSVLRRSLLQRLAWDSRMWYCRCRACQSTTRSACFSCPTTSPRTLTLWSSPPCNWSSSPQVTTTHRRPWTFLWTVLLSLTNTTSIRYGRRSWKSWQRTNCTSKRLGWMSMWSWLLCVWIGIWGICQISWKRECKQMGIKWKVKGKTTSWRTPRCRYWSISMTTSRIQHL